MLNYGNISKSKILKYHFFIEIDNENFRKQWNIYHKYLLSDEFVEYRKIEKYLHDSRIKIQKELNNINIQLDYWKDESNCRKKGLLVFENSKIISWNKVLKSGHISRINKKIIPLQYGYDEFYSINGIKYVTIIFFTRGKCRKINTGIYYPMLTLKYDSMKVKYM